MKLSDQFPHYYIWGNKALTFMWSFALNVLCFIILCCPRSHSQVILGYIFKFPGDYSSVHYILCVLILIECVFNFAWYYNLMFISVFLLLNCQFLEFGAISYFRSICKCWINNPNFFFSLRFTMCYNIVEMLCLDSIFFFLKSFIEI